MPRPASKPLAKASSSKRQPFDPRTLTAPVTAVAQAGSKKNEEAKESERGPLTRSSSSKRQKFDPRTLSAPVAAAGPKKKTANAKERETRSGKKRCRVEENPDYWAIEEIWDARPPGSHPTHFLVKWKDWDHPGDYGVRDQDWIPKSHLCRPMVKLFLASQQQPHCESPTVRTLQIEEPQRESCASLASFVGREASDKEQTKSQGQPKNTHEKKQQHGIMEYDEEGVPYYDIEGYLDRRRIGRGNDMEYLINWRGYSVATWEAFTNLSPLAKEEVRAFDFDQLRREKRRALTGKTSRHIFQPKGKRCRRQLASASSARPRKKQTPIKPWWHHPTELAPDEGFSPGHKVECIREISDEKGPVSFASRLFRDKGELFALERIYNSGQFRNLPPLMSESSYHRREYRLLATKHGDSQSGRGCINGKPQSKEKKVTAYYVHVGEKGRPPLTNLQNVLDRQGAFCRLPPSKLVARLELLVTPALKKGKKDFFDESLTSCDFEIIPETCNEGCGFIPRHYIQRLLGTGSDTKRIFALQVRIFAPKLGIFKGVLFEKPGISKIQLPSSMRKVGPSEKTDGVCDNAFLLVKNSFPGRQNKDMAKLFQGRPTKSFLETPTKKLNNMLISLLRSLGVNRDLVENYKNKSLKVQNQQHANLVGLADPSNGAIPPGHIFLTGARDLVKVIVEKKVLFTRYPCTSLADAQLLPIVRTKPKQMTASHWRFLQSLPFGAVVFGNSLPGNVPLPCLIADGDLDGDLYVVCWNRQIISTVKCDGILEVQAPAEKAATEPPCNSNWLEDAQMTMGDIGIANGRQVLVGKLYNLWILEKATFSSADVDAFGRAYKEALKITKHGGKVPLPQHLWRTLPPYFRDFLYSDEEQDQM